MIEFVVSIIIAEVSGLWIPPRPPKNTKLIELWHFK
jgi:hypothetical protein